MTLSLACRIRLTLALLLIGLMSTTLSSGTVHRPTAPAPVASHGLAEEPPQNDHETHLPDEK
jgi:hypothetical protein